MKAGHLGHRDEKLPFAGELAARVLHQHVVDRDEILGLPGLRVSPTCVRVPVLVGHAVALRATFASKPSVERALAAMKAFPGVQLDDRATPVAWAGKDDVAVGRVRPDLGDDYSLNADKDYSVLEIADAFGGPVEMIDGDPGRMGATPPSDKARRELGWAPTLDVMDYIAEFVRTHERGSAKSA